MKKNTYNFNAEYEDISYMQQYIASHLFHKSGHHCFNTEHVRLFLNDEFLGLYLSVENMDEEFLIERNLDPYGGLYKAKIDGASLSIYDNVYYHWDINTETSSFTNLKEIIELFDNTSINDYYNFANNYLKYEEMVNILAVNLLLRNYSTYYHNFFMYHDVNNSGKWTMLPWDLDKVFLYYEFTYPYHHTSKFWAPDNPFLEKAILCEPIFHDIKLRINELYDSYFNNNYITHIIDSLKPIIEPSVLQDTTDNINDINAWIYNLNKAKTTFEDRYNHLLYQFENYALSFEVERTKPFYKSNESVTFHWNSTQDPFNRELTYSLFYGKNINLDHPETTVITNITDTSYTLNNALSEGKYYWKVIANTDEYNIEGFNNYNFFHIIDDIPKVVINEINYKSSSAFDSGDWIELFNNSCESINISNWEFKDQNDDNIFIIPNETVIQPNGYLIIAQDVILFKSKYPDVQNIIGDFDFGLSSEGELIRIYNDLDVLVDYVIFDEVEPWATGPNGAGYTLELINPNLDNSIPESWQESYISFGTPGARNSSYNQLDNINVDCVSYLSVFPNPFVSNFEIMYYIPNMGTTRIIITNNLGQIVESIEYSHSESGFYQKSFNYLNLKNGIYFISLIHNSLQLQTIKMVKI